MSNSDFEPVDNTEVSVPTRLRLPQTRVQQMQAMIRRELSRQAEESGEETFEEADDLEPDDEDAAPYSRYELADLDGRLDSADTLAKPVEPEGQPPAGPAASPEGSPSPTPKDGEDGKVK